MKPLIFSAIGVAVILAAVVAFPAFLGREKTAPAATASSSPSAGVSDQPVQSVTPSQPVDSSAQGSPVPVASFQQYKVLAGDSVARIAVKFHLQRWELLLANPQLTPPNYAVRLNTYLNIPVPGQLTPPPAAPTAAPTVSPGPTLVAP